MARATFVKSARKNYPDKVIKKGDSYWWWKFRFGGKHMSKTAPRRSQLTQSGFLATMYDVEDTVGDDLAAFEKGDIDLEGLASSIENAASEVQSAGEECEEKRSNMPESLQESDTGQILENRSEQCQTIADELENAASEIRDLEADEDDENPKSEEDIKTEAANIVQGIGWDYE